MSAALQATSYAQLGYAVLPVRPGGKAPSTAHGLRDATLDADVIAKWQPSVNTGILPPETVLVLDADDPDEVRALEREYPELKDAPRCDTPSGGAHFYVRLPPDTRPLKASVRVLGRSLDLRGLGRAYLVAPPSSLPMGRYLWRRPLVSPDDLPECPAALLELLAPPDKPPVTPTKLPTPPQAADHARRYALAALQYEHDNVATAAPGSRNHTLNRAAFSLGQLVGSGALACEEAEEALRAAAATCGLTSREAEATLKSGLAAGTAQPRAVPEPKTPTPKQVAPTVKQEPPEALWPELGKLPPTAPEVPTLPAEMIPEPLRPWIDDVATRLCVHREYVAVPALVSLGAVVGRTVGIHPKQFDEWLEVPNLWGALVGPPSSKKSPAQAEGSAPLDRLAALAAEAYADAQAEREADAEIIRLELETIKKRARAKGADPADFRNELQAKLSALEDNDVPERRYLTNDGTIEKIGQLLKENPRGLLVKRDELIGLLRTCDKAGHESDRAFYLEAWNGRSRHTIDRIGRGTLHIPALTLSVLGGIQPGPLAGYVRGAVEGAGGADGLLQRFQLLVWPDRQRPYVNVDRYADTAAKNRAFEIFEFLDSKTGEYFGAKKDELNPDSIPALRFTPQAQGLFNDWLESLMRRLLSPELEATPAFLAHLSKYPSLMPSLALLFHLVDIANGSEVGPVSVDAADLAAAWCDFLEFHARKLYALELNREAASAHALAERVQQGEIHDGQNVSDLYRRRFPGLVTADEVNAALHDLEACHWLRVKEIPNKGARPSRLIRLHPDFRGA